MQIQVAFIIGGKLQREFLAHEQPTVFDWLPKVNGRHGIHSRTRPGDDKFPRNSL
jgi:hypothetical protein